MTIERSRHIITLLHNSVIGGAMEERSPATMERIQQAAIPILHHGAIWQFQRYLVIRFGLFALGGDARHKSHLFPLRHASRLRLHESSDIMALSQ